MSFVVMLIKPSLLETIAQYCPLEGGDAVYRSRALLSLLGQNGIYDDLKNCQVFESRKSKEIDKETLIQLFPNPGNQLVTISGFNSERNNELIIYDWSGRQIEYFSLENGLFIETINTTDWIPGVYYLRSIKDKSYITKKFVIIH